MLSNSRPFYNRLLDIIHNVLTRTSISATVFSWLLQNLRTFRFLNLARCCSSAPDMLLSEISIYIMTFSLKIDSNVWSLRENTLTLSSAGASGKFLSDLSPVLLSASKCKSPNYNIDTYTHSSRKSLSSLVRLLIFNSSRIRLLNYTQITLIRYKKAINGRTFKYFVEILTSPGTSSSSLPTILTTYSLSGICC